MVTVVTRKTSAACAEIENATKAVASFNIEVIFIYSRGLKRQNRRCLVSEYYMCIMLQVHNVAKVKKELSVDKHS